MKFKTLPSMIAVFFTFFSLLRVVNAGQISWNNIEYTASAYALILNFAEQEKIKEDYQEAIGPPLPVDASAYVNREAYYASGYSRVDDSTINISTQAYSCG